MDTLDLFRLDGSTAIVTGGGRGLGRYMAEALSDAIVDVLVELEWAEQLAAGAARSAEDWVATPEQFAQRVRELVANLD